MLDFARDKDQEDNLWTLHLVDQSWEEFGFVSCKKTVLEIELFQADGEHDITRANDVLNSEFLEGHVVSKLHNNLGILARCQT